MNKSIKRLQRLLSEGKINPTEYAADLKELLDDELVTQEEFDEAEGFEAEDEDSKLVFSQEDFNRQLVPKSRSLIKKALKDAGVDLDGVDNKDLLTTFAGLALQGQKKGSLSVDEAGLNELQKKAKKFDDMQSTYKALTLENAVLKAAGTYNPLNPKQVVRALSDYEDYLEYDEDDKLVAKSVDKALKELAKAEPNLFTAASEDQEDDKQQQQNNNFQGKTPGGAGGTITKEQQKQATLKAEALELMGIKKQQQQN